MVVLIIGILAAVAVPQYQKAVEKSKMAKVWLTLSSIEKAYDICRLEMSDEDCGDFSNLALSFVDNDGNSVTGTRFTKGKFTYEILQPTSENYEILAYNFTDVGVLGFSQGIRRCYFTSAFCTPYGITKSTTDCPYGTAICFTD